ncbi:hypothetical protein HDU98_010543 [Podochytrium sp. JEL0797]|nr:hypothetical protein HDU98_010543 [Podochytrium sp. JEL0797]
MFVIKSSAVPRVLSGSPSTGIHVEIDLLLDFSKPTEDSQDSVAAYFDVEFGESKVGSATIDSLFPLRAGETSRTVKLDIFPNAKDANAILATRNLVSKFGAGETIQIFLANGILSVANVPNSAMSEAIKTAVFPITVPENKTRIVQQVTAFMPPNPFNMSITGKVTLTNPFDCEFEVLRFKGECKYESDVIGTVNAAFGAGEMRVPPKGTLVSPKLKVSLVINMEAVYVVMDSMMKGKALVSGITVVACCFGGYEVEFDYVQLDIPLVLLKAMLTATSTTTTSQVEPSAAPKTFKEAVIGMHRTLSNSASIVSKSSKRSYPLIVSLPAVEGQDPAPLSARDPFPDDDDDEYDDNHRYDHDEQYQEDQPLSELECALEVGQHLLDQNQSLEASLQASRDETEYLLCVMAKMDPDLVNAAMAEVQGIENDQGGLVENAAEEEEEVEADLRAERQVFMAEIDALKDQVQELTTQNTKLKSLTDPLRETQRVSLFSSAASTLGSPTNTHELEARIREYDLLVTQLKSQLSASHSNGIESSFTDSPPTQPHARDSSSSSSSESHVEDANLATLRRIASKPGLSHSFITHSPLSKSFSSFFPSFNHTTSPPAVENTSLVVATAHLKNGSARLTASPTTSTHPPTHPTPVPTPAETAESFVDSRTHLDPSPPYLSHHAHDSPDLKTPHSNPPPPRSNSTGHSSSTHPPLTSTNINVIVRLMMGGTLLKYNRRRTKCEPRFVCVNPYSRTISWSKSEPGKMATHGGDDEITTVYMQTVFVEDLTDGRSRIVVRAKGREVVFQCGSKGEHEVWERGLTLVLQQNHDKC